MIWLAIVVGVLLAIWSELRFSKKLRRLDNLRKEIAALNAKLRERINKQ